jgi:hypothetical protein
MFILIEYSKLNGYIFLCLKTELTKIWMLYLYNIYVNYKLIFVKRVSRVSFQSY